MFKRKNREIPRESVYEGKKDSGKCSQLRAQNNSMRTSSQKGLGAKTNRRAELAEKINRKAARLARFVDLSALYFRWVACLQANAAVWLENSLLMRMITAAVGEVTRTKMNH